MTKPAQYVVNEKGDKISVVIDIEEYRRMLEELEELEDIRAYDAAKASSETPIPFSVATDEIERSRK
ncbi:MAG TPA: hypothetical protein VEU31_01200 [Candidatus Acidoferrales bacterium]|jgi:hypothetical protein|nr:hypothetical protein [Candidatus Acidoferrales bacterium]